ncbi:MAG: methylated-DNA--[protein]-cysteine S-methyltransferase [Nitrospirae bacterium]|nr:methylated-DNA--[protein]-cysteine S-methyltransferase [Nitrospirota bacterium]
MTQLTFSPVDTPIGWVYIVTDGAAVVEITFEMPPYPQLYDGGRAASELQEYMIGKRFTFDVPIKPGRHSKFYAAVYKALREIPYGATRSYKELAAAAASPNAARAVGQAMGRNPIPIILPCHRVIASDGSLGGYTGGVTIKEQLLALERRYAHDS